MSQRSAADIIDFPGNPLPAVPRPGNESAEVIILPVIWIERYPTDEPRARLFGRQRRRRRRAVNVDQVNKGA